MTSPEPGRSDQPISPEEEALANAVDHAVPAPIDRALRRDHSLCGAEPCSDCR